MMFRTLLIIFLSIGFVGTVYWGYKEHEEKNALLIHAENSYQRSFHELSYHMDMLHDSIGTSLAMNSGEKLSPQFVEIWRITSDALSNVSQLPLSLVPVHETEQFLSNIGHFTYRTAIRDLDDEPLNEEEMDTLESLYKEADHLKNELRQMQYDVLENNLRWMDVELALATQAEPLDPTIIDGFENVEKYINQYTKEEAAAPLLQTIKSKGTYESVKGKNYKKKEIEAFTKKLFSLKDKVKLDINKSGDGADIPMYSVFYEDGKRVYMDITEKGAFPISILVERDIKEAKLSLNEGLEKAKNYIEQFGYDHVEVLQSQQFNETGIYTFLHVQDDVRLYPDSIVVKIALDNGEIIGFNAQEHLANHHERKIKQPKIKLEEAKELVNGQIKIHDEHLAIIQNELDEEVLVYEFLGERKDESYRIFINAETGSEEKVEKLTNTEINFEAGL